MKNSKVVIITQAAMIAAIYIVLVYVFDSISFGPIQFRIAECLTILPFFTVSAIPGLFIGCMLANILGGAILADVIFGSIATLIGALGTFVLGNKLKNKCPMWIATLPPIIANTLIVPWVLKFGYGMPEAIPYMMLTVGIGEIIICAGGGLILGNALKKHAALIFSTAN